MSEKKVMDEVTRMPVEEQVPDIDDAVLEAAEARYEDALMTLKDADEAIRKLIDAQTEFMFAVGKLKQVAGATDMVLGMMRVMPRNGTDYRAIDAYQRRIMAIVRDAREASTKIAENAARILGTSDWIYAIARDAWDGGEQS